MLTEQNIKIEQSSALFDPLYIGKLKLSGRMAKSATVETLCTRQGYITDEYIQFYEEIAAGETPLIITGAASYDTYSRGVPHQLSVDADDKIEGLKRLADTVHKYDSKVFVQIYHTARQALPGPVGRADAQAPSAVYEPTLGVRPRAMSVPEIQDSIRLYADAVERCKKAGIDGVQIHAAHGYLISAFLTPHTNRRKDQYGGSFENRTRFLVELYRAVRQRVGDEYPLILKINGSDDLPFRKGLSTAELVKVATKMEHEGINAVEISAGHYESCTTFERGQWKGYTRAMLKDGPGQAFSWPKRLSMYVFAPLIDRLFNKVAGFSEGFNLNYAKQFTAALKIPVICVGGFVDKTSMDQALTNQECDMVSIARGLLADPLLYKHLKENRSGPVCNFCNACFTKPGSSPIGCYNEDVKAQVLIQTELNQLLAHNQETQILTLDSKAG